MARVGAFFDVDRTIVSCNTGRLFLRDLRRRGEISFFRTLRALGWMAKYHLSLIDLQWVATRLAGEMAGRLEREFADAAGGWVEKDVLPLVVPGAREKIEKHRAEGHVLAILSTSPCYVTEPLAEVLGIEEVISTRFEVADGLFTGRLLGPACVGRGKVHWAEDLVARRERRPQRRAGSTRIRTPTCRCWSGSATRSSSTPIRACSRIAKRRGWPVQDWRQPTSAAAGEVRA